MRGSSIEKEKGMDEKALKIIAKALGVKLPKKSNGHCTDVAEWFD